MVVGNPPWGSIAKPETPAGKWCAENNVTPPDNQIAAAFIRKAPMHVSPDGKVCFVLPHGVLFNHGDTAITFQKDWVTSCSLELVLNLADYQRFLFEAEHPAVVVRFTPRQPKGKQHAIEYWSPKSDWSVTTAEVIAVAPRDRTQVLLKELMASLDGLDAPSIWKQRYWATPRDWRLLDRLFDLPRLRDYIRQIHDDEDAKPWIMGQGIQPLGPGDKLEDSKTIELPSRYFLDARNRQFDLFLNPSGCTELSQTTMVVRGRSGVGGVIFEAPHVIVTRGFSRCAYADFDVAFRSSIRGIHGPKHDAQLLAFLAAYLKAPIAKYFLFHTSNWGLSRAEVQDNELLRLPFPLPRNHNNPKDAEKIVSRVAEIVGAASKSVKHSSEQKAAVANAMAQIEPLIDEYFDILPMERDLINDTINVSIPSTRPTRARPAVPTVMNSSAEQRKQYIVRVCEMLNRWSRRGPSGVRGQAVASEKLGVGLAVLEKVDRARLDAPMEQLEGSLTESLARLQKLVSRKQAALDFVRGVKVFDGNRLYVVKPLAQRNWTLTAAMNDADEIVGTILMQPQKEHA